MEKLDLIDTTVVIKSIDLIERNNEVIGAKLLCHKFQKEDELIKFTLWKNKLDGTPTKAYEVFKKKGYEVGSSVSFMYKSEPRVFTNNDGEEITTVNRTIAWFKYAGVLEDDTFKEAPKTVTEQIIKDFQAEIVDEIKIDDIPF